MSGLRFSVLGIPVRVDLTFWLIIGLFGFNRLQVPSLGAPSLVAWVALVFVGILAHEMGHALAFRKFGREPDITLYGMGGLTSAQGRLQPGQRLVTTLAGPFTGFAVGGLVFAAVQVGLWDPNASALQRQIYLDLLFVNLGWGILNLVPLYPLDGGQSFEALLQIFKVKQAVRITSLVSIATAVAGGVWAGQNNQPFLALFALFFGFTNFRRLQAGDAVPIPQGAGAGGASPQLMQTMNLAEQALEQGRPAEAIELLEQERRLRPSPQTTRAYAAILARTRHGEGAEQLLATDEQLDTETLTVLASSLVATGRYEAGLRAAERAWSADDDGHWQNAVTAAAARAGLRDVDGALRWLFTAVSRGWDDERRLAADPVFAEVRADPRVGEVLQRMRAAGGA